MLLCLRLRGRVGDAVVVGGLVGVQIDWVVVSVFTLVVCRVYGLAP